MAMAAAALRDAMSVTTIAAPWRFSGFPAEASVRLSRLWHDAEPAAAATGLLPMEVLQSAFWSLDPARTVAKFEAFADMDSGTPEERAFVRPEDWANEGPPLPAAAARGVFEAFLCPPPP